MIKKLPETKKRECYHIVSKVTSIVNSCIKLEEYIISEDFFYPLIILGNENSIQDAFSTNMFNYHQSTESENNSRSFCTEVPSEMYGHASHDSICPCVANLTFLKFRHRIKVKIDAVVFSVIMLELKRSKKFRINVLSNFFTHYVPNVNINTFNLCTICNKTTVMIHITVYVSTPKKNIIDYKWNGRIQVMINEKCEMENAMAWLSTLGGAFSALGDTYVECAEKAGKISVQQLCIALRLGDPLTVCRCKIYIAMSFLQMGYYGRTKKIIWKLYKFSTEGEGSKDFRLKNMCIAVWNRLKYLKSHKSINSH